MIEENKKFIQNGKSIFKGGDDVGAFFFLFYNNNYGRLYIKETHGAMYKKVSVLDIYIHPIFKGNFVYNQTQGIVDLAIDEKMLKITMVGCLQCV